MKNESVCRIRAFRLWQALVFLLVAALAITALVAVARGQQTPVPPAASPAPSAATNLTATSSPTPIPLAEVVAQADTVSANLRTIEADLASPQITANVEAELPVLMREIDARFDESQKILNSRPSLETLKNLESEWETLDDKVVVWRRDLTIRATALDREITRLTQLDQTWSNTLAQAESVRTPTVQ